MRLPLLLTLSLTAALGATPDWVKQVVCPMVGPFGPKSVPPGRTAEQILADYRPEIAEWSFLPSLTTHPLRPRGISGGLEYQEFPQSLKADFANWQKRFGSPWTPTEECGAAVPSGGQIASWKYGSDNPDSLWFVCHNAPKWHTFHKESLVAAGRTPGSSLVRQDNIGGPSGVTGDQCGWCKWCLAGYKERLAKRFTAARLRELGITELATWDARAYLLPRLKEPAEVRLEQPLVREYVRFMTVSNLGHWRDEVETVHAATKADLPVCGNQGGGDPAPYGTVLLSDIGDLIFLESSRRQWPNNGSSLYYALALAGGRHAKPAWIWGFGYPEQMAAVAGSELFVAECYANGATPYYELNNLGWTAKLGYHAITLGDRAYPALARYAQFAHAQAPLLTEAYAAEAPVALLYSVPTWLPRFCGALHLGADSPGAKPLLSHLLGFARALETRHIPYNVEILGDDEAWPDRDLPARLARYRVVIAPSVEALSNAQADALRAFVAGGGRVITSGPFGTRDETFAKRPAPVALSGDRVVRLADEPAQYATAQAVTTARGAVQVVEVNQTVAKPLVVRGWSKAENVSPPSDGEYSLWVDLKYQDDTPLWAQVAKFKTGTHDWQASEFVIYPQKPVKSASVHVLFRYHSGTAWFDDLFLGEQGSDRNLLRNPGFEEGDNQSLTGWAPVLGWQEQAAGYQVSTVARAGRRSMSCAVPRPTGEPPAVAALGKLLVDTVAATGPVLTTDAPPTLFCRPVRRGATLVVHLLNLNVDTESDTATPVGPCRLSIPLPAGQTAGAVRLLSPDGPAGGQVLTAQVGQGLVTVNVPGVRIWSLVAVALK